VALAVEGGMSTAAAIDLLVYVPEVWPQVETRAWTPPDPDGKYDCHFYRPGSSYDEQRDLTVPEIVYLANEYRARFYTLPKLEAIA